jgi:hypothetical protein
MFDRKGCGRDAKTREYLEADLEGRLNRSGWGGRAAAIVIDPELENWVWTESAHVELVLGWKGRSPDLRLWLVSERLLAESASKPAQPKEAMEKALRMVKKPRSSSLYMRLAETVSPHGCTDRAFLRLRTALSSWFGDAA